jgi:hypothetical protein
MDTPQPYPDHACPLCGHSHEISKSICISCEYPLCPAEVSAGVDYHFSCLFCKYCKESINEQVVSGIRRDGRPFSHKHCYDRAMEEEIRRRPVTITQAHFDYINSFRLMFESNMDLGIETNQKDAEIELDKFKRIHEMSYEEIFLFGKRCEAAAAWCMLALEPLKKEHKIKLQERDISRVKEIEERRKTDQRKIEEKKLNKLPDIRALKAIGMSTEEAQGVILREKAIQAKMTIGMTRTQAEASLAEGGPQVN